LKLNINMNKNEIIFDFWIIPQKLNVTQPGKGLGFLAEALKKVFLFVK